MTKKLKTEAIVLKKKNLPTKDILITVFSEDFGKIVVFAKGVKSITSRRLPHLQTANLISAIISKSNDRLYLAETTLISAFSAIKKDPRKVDLIYFMFYILDRLLPENHKEPQIYDIVKKFIVSLSKPIINPKMQLQKYLNLILYKLGYIDAEKSLSELKQTIESLTNEKIPHFIYN